VIEHLGYGRAVIQARCLFALLTACGADDRVIETTPIEAPPAGDEAASDETSIEAPIETPVAPPPACADPATYQAIAATSCGSRASRSGIAFDPGQSGFRIALADPNARQELVEVCGRVGSLTAPAQGATERRWALAIEGSQSAFLVSFPENVPPPIATGDVVSIRLRTETIRIHRVVHGTLADAGGRLLGAFSDGGDAAWAPGWSVEIGRVVARGEPHMRGGARSEDREISLAYAGSRVRVPYGRWLRFCSDDGDWVVTGAAHSWTRGMLPPDAATYHTFALMRVVDR
jgi:hypothetical protein